MTPCVKSEDVPVYAAGREADDATIAAALAILERRVAGMLVNPVMEAPKDATDYLRLRCAGLEHEVFGCVWLDAQHRVLGFEEMFRGTLTQTSVFPREVAKRALAVNAAAVMFWHNHPSGSAEPSRCDELLTTCLKTALALVDVRVLDHFVVTDGAITSFAKRGLL